MDCELYSNLPFSWYFQFLTKFSQFLEMDVSTALSTLQMELVDNDRQLKDALKEVSIATTQNDEHTSLIQCINEQISDAHGMVAR